MTRFVLSFILVDVPDYQSSPFSTEFASYLLPPQIILRVDFGLRTILYYKGRLGLLAFADLLMGVSFIAMHSIVSFISYF
ncbi:hypothetical protein BDV41DRAFT_520081 [Aspergillus transmontanensis]|uniref:Uncharacterized protein n=1 Tax=Aspergillus transmontanensis TaxID=1034304 RepID=A0A5N6WF44_9EURO|nr:hypothetical protein BDV41DRAFT_520081 [Aspergillus transmontanensis]